MCEDRNSPNGDHASDALIHTSVGSQASPPEPWNRKTPACNDSSARPQFFSCDSSSKSDNLAEEKKFGLAKSELLVRNPRHLVNTIHESPSILAWKQLETVSQNEVSRTHIYMPLRRIPEHKGAIRNSNVDYATARHFKERNHGSAPLPKIHWHDTSTTEPTRG